MAIVTVTDDSFDADVLKSDKAVLVHFRADWSGPCKLMGFALEDISDDLSDKVTIAKIDVDQNTDTSSEFGVRGIPTMLLFKKGKMVAHQVGAVSRHDLKTWLEGEL